MIYKGKLCNVFNEIFQKNKIKLIEFENYKNLFIIKGSLVIKCFCQNLKKR